MRKTFVLDTNVLLHDPQALTRFEDNAVVIPIEVVEEIDRFKKDLREGPQRASDLASPGCPTREGEPGGGSADR